MTCWGLGAEAVGYYFHRDRARCDNCNRKAIIRLIRRIQSTRNCPALIRRKRTGDCEWSEVRIAEHSAAATDLLDDRFSKRRTSARYGSDVAPNLWISTTPITAQAAP